EHLSRRRIIEVGVLGRGWGFLGAVEGIDDQDSVPGFGETLAHLPEGWPQPENIGPYEHSRMLTGRRMHKVSISRAIVGLDLDLGFLRLCGVRQGWQRGNNPRSKRQGAERAP